LNGFVLVFLDNAAYASLPTLMLPAPDSALAGTSGRIFMQERWLPVDEIAAHLGVNPDTIYKWIIRKQMPAHKLGRLWKFLASEVDAWLKAGKAAAETQPHRGASEPDA
jgi:excisionase family DNA binding protein